MRRVTSESTDLDAPTHQVVYAPTARRYPTQCSRHMVGTTTLVTSLAILVLLLYQVGLAKELSLGISLT